MAILRNVAKSDTFEKQRQTINQVAADLFAIGGGGSDLSTGLLRLGDGTRTEPSLAFVNDTSVGIFRPGTKVLAFVSDGKKLHQIQNESSLYYRNVVLQKNILNNDGILITTQGQDYDQGDFEDIAVVGGTGQAGTFNLTVSPFDGTTTPGSGYIYNGDSLGTPTYNGVELLGGSGTGVVVNVEFSGGGFINTSINDYGDGYQLNDVLILPTQVTGFSGSILEEETTVTATIPAGITSGWFVTQTGGTATLETPVDVDGNPTDITIQNISLDRTSLDLNTTASVGGGGTLTLTLTPPWGNSGSNYAFTIDIVGIVTAVSINQPGEGYSIGDTLTVFNLDLTKPIPYLITTEDIVDVTFTTDPSAGTFVVGQSYGFQQEDPLNPGTFTTITGTCEEVEESGGIVTLVTFTFSGTDSVGSGDTLGALEVEETNTVARYLIDTGDGNPTRHPDLNLFVNNTYGFDYSSASSHPLRFSIHPDGIWNTYEFSATLTEAATTITVGDGTQILVGMQVTVSQDADISDEGSLDSETFVTEVNGNVVTIDKPIVSSGSAPLIFAGVEYTGSDVSVDNNITTIQPNDSTPTPLYYFCTQHPNMGGTQGNEAEVTIDPNNPKTFGSGFEVLVTDITSSDNITLDVSSGDVNAISVTSTDVISDAATITTANVDVVNVSDKVNTTEVVSPSNLLLSSTGLTSPVNIRGQKLSIFGPAENAIALLEITADTGDLTSAGTIKTTGTFNSSDILKIENANIFTTGTNDLTLTPAPNRVVKVDGVTALIIPSGNTAARPGASLVENGAIRYNTQTTQYEGYSDQTNSWSSLGGIRDLDGNTYVTAEESVGANDDTFYFYNGNSNTLKITPNKFKFEELKQIASLNTSAPAYTEWRSNTPVSLGSYLKHRNNIYEVTVAGVTATDGNAPTHTSGALPNNTSELTYSTTAVSNLLFQEINEVQIDPFGDTYLTISGDLRLRNNIISTDISDLTLQPNAGKKVVVDATSTLVLPVGNNDERGAPSTGSVRFNTTSSQFEGYDNNGNWGSLGGVKDVDQNTYIIPETSPGANENILYFYNDNTNTMQLSTASLDLTNIDTITSINNTSLALEFTKLTVDNNEFVLDNTVSDRTFIYNTRQYLQFGMSGGLTVDPILTIEDTGDIFYNTAFGTGNEENLKLLNNDLTEFEIRDYKVLTTTFDLVKGTSENGSALLYNKTDHKGCKVLVFLENALSNKSSMMEFSVIDNGTDIFYNEYGSLNSNEDGATAEFDFDIEGNARISLTLTNDHAFANTIKFTVVSQIVK
jgi:hypothetical protein